MPFIFTFHPRARCAFAGFKNARPERETVMTSMKKLLSGLNQNLAITLESLGEVDRARALYEAVLERQLATLGPALSASITEAFKQAFGSTLLPGYERASLLVKRRLLGQRLLARVAGICLRASPQMSVPTSGVGGVTADGCFALLR